MFLPDLVTCKQITSFTTGSILGYQFTLRPAVTVHSELLACTAACT